MIQAFVSSDLVFCFRCHVRAIMPAPVPVERPLKGGFDIHTGPPSQDGVCLSRVEAQSMSFMDALTRIA